MNVPYTQPTQSASRQAVTALVLGILGVVCCGLLAPVAWYLGSQELQAIQSGASPVAGQGFATAAKILGIIGTILLALSLIWVFFAGGMAVLSGLSQH